MIYSDRSRKSTYHLAAIRPSAHLPTQRSAYGPMSAFGTKRTLADCGSSGNLGVEPEPKATIQRFNADGSNQTTFASGTRNPTALAFNIRLSYPREEGGFYGWPYA